ncbi:CPBP family intramembrane glutamic endopeptidase [Pseudarthrobacter sp. MM222]|uniref:CPBP family intramembrane glutamic endopeptidase n=1 Tax=Pseudarthrobacter sp. MM222 TaxID=3018929 RepID=UPI002220EF23|nr:type II CAAX endopeptidase family protein [Pseudarthrobacter sp. MM222]CAI3798215.1 hypothetical protein NKCBBBOE_02021 [Pseudarthrobacter sp. MM222]
MDPITPEYARLRSAITERLNAHDLLGVLPHGAPADEYDPEMEDFARLIADGEPMTPEVVATVWHKWFGDSAGEATGEVEPPTPAMHGLAADLQTLQRGYREVHPRVGMPMRTSGDPLSAITASGMFSPTRGAGPVTLGQAAWALMFIGVYIAVVAGVILALGLPGIIDFTLESLLFVLLTAVTAAAILALYMHLVRRNHLTPADLGFRRPTPRLFHLLWQIPVTIIVCAFMQALSLGLLTLAGMDTTTAGADDPLTDIAGLPTFLAVIAALIVVVLTPLWEEVLFRGAFLGGLSRRFRPTVAIILSAAIFAAVHVIPLSFPYLFTLGIALALLRRFHQNLWAPILLHAANNALVVLLALIIAR